jgi:DNA-binding ferritin-like protein
VATEAPLESIVAAGLRRIVADAVMLRFLAETAIWNLDATSAGAAMLLERASVHLDELMRGAAIRLHVLQGSSHWSLDEIRALSRVSGKEVALGALAREISFLCEDCHTIRDHARRSNDDATERLLAARVAPLEQSLWGLNQFCRIAPVF